MITADDVFKDFDDLKPEAKIELLRIAVSRLIDAIDERIVTINNAFNEHQKVFQQQQNILSWLEREVKTANDHATEVHGIATNQFKRLDELDKNMERVSNDLNYLNRIREYLSCEAMDELYENG